MEYKMSKFKTKRRYVYGNRTKKWYLVSEKDRDYIDGIPQNLFKRIGKKRAKELYLENRIV